MPESYPTEAARFNWGQFWLSETTAQYCEIAVCCATGAVQIAFSGKNS